MTDRPTTLITGASSGIGAALAWQAAADGHDLILTARRASLLEAEAEALFRRYGIRVLTVEADLSQPEGADHLYNQIAASGWKVDFLVNNAGLGAHGPFTDLSPARLADMLHVNMLSLTTLSRLLLPAMVSRGHGGILHVASVAAFQPGPLMSVYYASKAYVLSLSEALTMETARTGVRISCLCPGPTQTGFAREADMEESALFRRGVMSATEVARVGWMGFRKGRRVIIPGWLNRVLAFGGRHSPHWLTLRVVRRLHQKR